MSSSPSTRTTVAAAAAALSLGALTLHAQAAAPKSRVILVCSGTAGWTIVRALVLLAVAADLELDRVGIEGDAFVEKAQGFVVATFVVELMCTFVIFVGTEELVRHRTGPPGKVVL